MVSMEHAVDATFIMCGRSCLDRLVDKHDEAAARDRVASVLLVVI